MTQEELLYNKRCAEFLNPEGKTVGSYYFPKFGQYFNKYGEVYFEECFMEGEMKFHSDWNWIMEVVEAIERLQYQNNNDVFKVVIDYGMCIIYNMINDLEVVVNTCESNKKQAVVKAIDQFLIWYDNGKRI